MKYPDFTLEFSGDTRCVICNQKGLLHTHLHRHMVRCAMQKSKGAQGQCHVFPRSQKYVPKVDLIEELLARYPVTILDKSFSPLSCFDIETAQVTYPEPVQKGQGTGRVIGHLTPICIGISSNLENRKFEIFWAKDGVNGAEEAIEQFLDYLDELSLQAAEIAKKKFGQLHAYITQCLEVSKDQGSGYGIRLHSANLKRLERFMFQLVCLGFNSSVSCFTTCVYYANKHCSFQSFDIQCLKSCGFLTALMKRFTVKGLFIRMRGLRYSQIGTPRYVFWTF